jgi:hypothetical protein
MKSKKRKNNVRGGNPDYTVHQPKLQSKINSSEGYRDIFHSLQLIYKRQDLIDEFDRGNLDLNTIFLTGTNDKKIFC